MNYSETIAYLYSLTDYEKTRLERYTDETLDLGRIRRLLAEAGDPQASFPSVHVAGTKGKGSTAAVVESCLRAAGHRTGLYTSPHLQTFRERIRVAGENIGQGEVVALVEEMRPWIERVPGVTYFEAVTALGFLAFARAGIDVGVIEVGLGGRLDATNVLLPEVSIITSLSLEHTYLLGDTLAEIAFEKAGIVKPGVPVVSAPQREEALQVIDDVSRERGSPLVVIGRDWEVAPGAAGLEGQSFAIRRVAEGGSALDGEYRLALLGRHQVENASCALAALDVLRGRGLDVPVDAVREGLRAVRWPGRMEVLSRDPPVVVDGAHNVYSMEVLRRALEEWFPGRRWVVVFGAFVDKDAAGMLRVLLPVSSYCIVTRSNHPRAAAPVEIADVVASLGGGAEISVNVEKALRRGLAVLGPEDGLLVTGSINLVGAARGAWDKLVPCL